MKRMGWGSKSSAKFFESREEETAAFNDAQAIAAYVMNDEISRALKEIQKGSSPVHKLGYGAGLFWEAVLGFDKAKMIEASNALSEAEAANAEFKKAAASGKYPATFHSKIYPDGSEFAIAEAMCQLLGAILGILKESWLESLAGLNKLRKAYFLVQSLHEAERKYLQLHPPPAQSQTSLSDSRPSTSIRSPPVAPQKQLPVVPPAPAAVPPPVPSKQHSIRRKPVASGEDDDSDDEFFDADDDVHQDGSVTNGNPVPAVADMHIGDAPRATRTGSIVSTAKSNRSFRSSDEPIDFRQVTNDPIELFVHSSANMCWGILQIILSFIPPAFRHILSMFSFRGDRDNGLRILWETTNYKDNIFGAISSMVVLLYHNIAVSLADILPRDAVPEERLNYMLAELRQLYPDSQLWVNEEARIAINHRQLEKAAGILSKPNPGSTFEEMQGLRVFELGLDLMFLHRFEECSETFIYCCKVNRWSHGMYYFIAAVCNVELYRDNKTSNPALAKKYADKAKEILKTNKVAQMVRQKALLGQQLPFDAFIQTKLDKWEARAKARKCDLIDAVGISPVEEFSYFWTGYRRMNPQQSQRSLSRLIAWEATEEWSNETVDERAGSAVLKAVCLRNLGRTGDAKALLDKGVFSYSDKEIRACPHAIQYPYPVAHYEKGVCFWVEAGGPGGNASLLKQAKDEIEVAYNSSGWELEERMVVKLMAARETFRKLKI